MSNVGFTLGNHTFLHPSENASIDRLGQPPKLIRGGAPPSVFAGIVRDADPETPGVDDLLNPSFAGHDEPTVAVFEIVFDGNPDLEISAHESDEIDEQGYPVLTLVAARRKGDRDSAIVVYDQAWTERMGTLEGIAQRAPTAEEYEKMPEEDWDEARVLIGVEYPCDADSADCVSWITVYMVTSEGNGCLADAELA